MLLFTKQNLWSKRFLVEIILLTVFNTISQLALKNVIKLFHHKAYPLAAFILTIKSCLF